MLDTLLDDLLGLNKTTPSPPRRSVAPRKIRLSLEVLEDRVVPSGPDAPGGQYTVTRTGDLGVGMGNTGDLRYCITQANQIDGAQTLITFAPNVTGTISIGSTLTIHESMAIYGPGPSALTIQANANANNAYNVFTVDNRAATVEIDNMTIEGGYLRNGGGISNVGTLTLQSDVIQNNTAVNIGGGIYNAQSGILRLQNDDILFNQALVAGGGVYNSGTIQNYSKTDPTAIVANVAATDGGGIYNIGTVLLYGGEQISGNQANTTTGKGGGVFNAAGATFNMNGGTIVNNDAFQGGGLDSEGNATLGQGLTVKGNTASQGSGMYLPAGSTTTFNTVTVKGNNLTPGGVGKGVYASKTATLNGLTTLTDTDDPGGTPVRF